MAGEIISRPKIGDIQGEHQGILFPNNYVFHTTPEQNAHFTNLQTFGAGLPIRVHAAGVETQQELNIMWQRAQQLNGSLYSLGLNCEDISNLVRYGIKQSPTREKIAGATFVGLLLLAILQE